MTNLMLSPNCTRQPKKLSITINNGKNTHHEVHCGHPLSACNVRSNLTKHPRRYTWNGPSTNNIQRRPIRRKENLKFELISVSHLQNFGKNRKIFFNRECCANQSMVFYLRPNENQDFVEEKFQFLMKLYRLTKSMALN